jgi:DNA polymerase alpha subunit B
MNFEQQILSRLDKRPNVKADVRPFGKVEISNFYVRKEDKYAYVKHRLASMRPFFLELLGLASFEPVNHISEKSFYTFGIVVSPSGAKLDADNIFISSNVDDSNDVLVRLDLSFLDRYSVFPGQIVAIKGKNVMGNQIVVEVLHCMPLLDCNTADPGKYAGSNYIAPSVIACAGPYGSESGFDVLDSILTFSADVLVLLGPFVGRGNEDAGCSPVSAFKSLFVPRIRSWLEKNAQSKIVLAPSMCDLMGINVYPQGPLDVRHSRILCVGNPGSFYLNNHLIALSTLDSPLELCSGECFVDRESTTGDDVCGRLLFSSDRNGRIAHHMVFQHTFLPAFPSMNTVSYSVPESLDMSVAPDIYLVSSKLKHFVREAGPSIVVNVGSQSRLENKAVCHVKMPAFGSNAKPQIELRNFGRAGGTEH